MNIDGNHKAVKAAFSHVKQESTLRSWVEEADAEEIEAVARFVLLNRGQWDSFPKGQEEQKLAAYKAFKVIRETYKQVHKGYSLHQDSKALTVSVGQTTPRGGTNGKGSNSASSGKSNKALSDATQQVQKLVQDKGSLATQVVASLCVQLGIEADDLREDIERIKSEQDAKEADSAAQQAG